jgi:hypothetical protein
MSSKQLIPLLILVVLLGAAGLVIHQRNRSAYQGAGRSENARVMDKFPFNDVAQVTIQQGTNELHLAKKDIWRVVERYDYPANFGDLSQFLITVSDLKARQQEEIGPSQLGRLELDPGSRLEVGFLDQSGKMLALLRLGKTQTRKSTKPSPMGEGGEETMPTGRWAQSGADTNHVVLVADTFDRVTLRPDQWLDKEFLKISKLRQLSVAYTSPTNSYRVSRESETAPWKLVDAKPGEELDSSKASGLSYFLNSSSIADVLPPGAPLQQNGLDKPTVAVLDTFDGFTYTLQIGAKTNEDYAVRCSVTAPEWIQSTNVPNEIIEKFTAEALAEQGGASTNKDLSPAAREQLQKKLAESRKASQDKFAQEKSFEKWTYLVSSYTLEPLLKERAQLLVEKKPTGAATNAVPSLKMGGGMPNPGGVGSEEQ